MVYQLRIDLKGAKPPIWRRILIDASGTLYDLHCAIQGAFGWYNGHLHGFYKGRTFFGIPDDEFTSHEAVDEQKTLIANVLGYEGDVLDYEYDFGDGWEHRIKLEKILAEAPTKTLPVCIKGKNARPPEDVGGLWGYYDFLEAINDPEHPDHAEMAEWIGDESYDPTWFDIKETNEMMTEGCIELW